jgi:hypothetical protein
MECRCLAFQGIDLILPSRHIPNSRLQLARSRGRRLYKTLSGRISVPSPSLSLSILFACRARGLCPILPISARCGVRTERSDLTTDTAFHLFFFFVFAEHRAFEHIEQCLTYRYGRFADTLLKPLTTDFNAVVAQYEGCFVGSDPNVPAGSTPGPNRLVGPPSTTFTSTGGLTQEKCYQYCNVDATNAPYKYMVVENAVNCRCSNTYGYTPRVSSTGCTKPAEGNAAEAGGGENAVNLWINKAYTDPVRQLSNCSKLKCSVLCNYFLLSHQGEYKVSTTALRPSHKHGGILWEHNGTMRHDDISTPINDRPRHHELDMQGDQPVSTPPLTFGHLTRQRGANMHQVHGHGKQGRSQGQGSDGQEMGSYENQICCNNFHFHCFVLPWHLLICLPQSLSFHQPS